MISSYRPKTVIAACFSVYLFYITWTNMEEWAIEMQYLKGFLDQSENLWYNSWRVKLVSAQEPKKGALWQYHTTDYGSFL